MKLYQVPASPFSRKVRILIIEAGLANRVTLVPQPPRDDAKGYFALNPFGRIPTLELDDGSCLFDSPLICEYLDTLAGTNFLPREGNDRWDVLKLQAIGDGLLDTLVPLRQETLRPAEHQIPATIDYAHGSAKRALLMLNKILAPGKLSIGHFAVGSALGYLDFRFPQVDWRSDAPALADWLAAFSQRPSYATTRP